MIILKTRETPPPDGHPGHLAGIKGFRWVFEVEPFFAGLRHQFRTDKDWHFGGGYYAVWLNKQWRWGRGHAYCDGPHDSFSLGFLHFNWQGNWCDRCAEEK